jgi:hypothetical protein
LMAVFAAIGTVMASGGLDIAEGESLNKVNISIGLNTRTSDKVQPHFHTVPWNWALPKHGH